MSNQLADVLKKIGEEFKEVISDRSRDYLEVDIGKKAESLGYPGLEEKYRDVDAVVPLKQPVPGMKVLIDGRTFVNYAQLESGVVVPGYVAREADLPFRTYEASDSMVRNFA
jgi:hypothetical protein